MSRDVDVERTNRCREALKKYLVRSVEPAPADLECISGRQLGSPVPGAFAVDRDKCRYGYSRAFVRLPVSDVTDECNSGMIRLSCPHLVKEIDLFEKNGGIEKINSVLNNESSEFGRMLKSNFLDINASWKQIRNDVSVDSDKAKALNYLGSEQYRHFFSSGFIGITETKVNDVKCLHAHLADYLLRGNNLIGQWVHDELDKKNVSVSGCAGKQSVYNSVNQ
jgi:hypothetical protein